MGVEVQSFKSHFLQKASPCQGPGPNCSPKDSGERTGLTWSFLEHGLSLISLMFVSCCPDVNGSRGYRAPAPSVALF